MPLSVFRTWGDADRLLAIALAKYEADIDPACGWPRTYTQHAQAQGHWDAPNPTRCHACDAIENKQKAYEKQENIRALRFSAVPDEGLWHAMNHPVVPSPPGAVGVSGLDYSGRHEVTG